MDIEKIGELEYIVDIDIGVCSCSNGTACKHQAAVAKAFNICTVNLAPYYSKEAIRKNLNSSYKMLRVVLIMKTTVSVLSPHQATWTAMGQVNLKN